MQSEAERIHGEVNAARDAYSSAESRLLAVVERFYVDRDGAAEQLLALANEFGSSQAVTAMLGRPDQFGTLAETATDGYVADMADTLEGSLEAVLVAQDRLDQAVALRERNLRQTNPSRTQVITIGGREFHVDPAGRELRSVDNPAERYLLVDDVGQHQEPRGPSLTEQVAREHASPKAQPSPSRSPTRGR